MEDVQVTEDTPAYDDATVFEGQMVTEYVCVTK